MVKRVLKDKLHLMLVSLPQSPQGLGWMELNRARRGKDTVRRQKFKTCASASGVGTVQCALAGSAPILSARFPLHSDFVYKNNFEKKKSIFDDTTEMRGR